MANAHTTISHLCILYNEPQKKSHIAFKSIWRHIVSAVLLASQHGAVCQVCESLMCAWHFYATMWPTLLGDSSLSHVCIILTYILRSECIERNLPSRLFLNLMRGGGEGDHLKYGCYGRCCRHARAIHGQEYSTSVHVLGADGECVGFYGKYVTGGMTECQMAGPSYFTD